jgi:hypothetical protein
LPGIPPSSLVERPSAAWSITFILNIDLRSIVQQEFKMPGIIAVLYGVVAYASYFWTVDDPIAMANLDGIFWFGWVLLVFSTFLISHFRSLRYRNDGHCRER